VYRPGFSEMEQDGILLWYVAYKSGIFERRTRGMGKEKKLKKAQKSVDKIDKSKGKLEKKLGKLEKAGAKAQKSVDKLEKKLAK